MEVLLEVKKRFDVKTLTVNANVRYWEVAEVNGEKDTEDGDLIPCKNGDSWCLEIDFDSGVIRNWKKGVTASVHYKVCDEGVYYLKDAEGNIVMEIVNDYVPKVMCPKDNGYGDYIIMDIDANGQIADWKPSISHFEVSEELNEEEV